MPKPPTTALQEHAIAVWEGRPNRVSVATVYEVITEHEYGDLARSAQLWELMLRDDRIGGTVDTRILALLGCPHELEAATVGERQPTARARRVVKDAEAWWFSVVSEQTLYGLWTWALGLGAGFGEILTQRTARKYTPREIKVWHPQHFAWDEQRSTWTVWTKTGRQDVVHGDGRWIVLQPFGPRSWMRGLIRRLANLWLIRQWGWRDLARLNERIGQGVFGAKVPKGAKDDVKSRFVRQVQTIGSEASILLPQGPNPGESYGLELIESNGKGFESIDRLLTATNVAIAIGVIGQNLTTEVQGGSYAAAKVQDHVRGDILAWDYESECTCLHTGLVTPWIGWNYGDLALAFWPVRAVEPPEDLKERALTLASLGPALATLKNEGVDVRRLCEEDFGLPMLPEDEVPDPKPPPGGTEDEDPALPDGEEDPTPPTGEDEGDEEGTGRATVRLASGAEVPRGDPFVEGQRYVDRIGDVGLRVARSAIAPELALVLRAIEAGTSLENIRQRLSDAHAEMSGRLVEEELEREMLQAELAGRHAVRLEEAA